MKTKFLFLGFLIINHSFAANSSAIKAEPNDEAKTVITLNSVDSSPKTLGFPKSLTYTATLSNQVKLRKKKTHKITIEYYKKDSNILLFEETHKKISIIENKVPLKLGKGKAKTIKYSSLQALFANNTEVEMSWTIDGEKLYPKIGILPSGHSYKSGLLLKGVKVNDQALHWKGFDNPSAVSAFASTTLTPVRTNIVHDSNIKTNPFELEMNGPYLSIPVRDMPLAVRSTTPFAEKEVNTLRHEQLYDKNGARFGTKSPKQDDQLAQMSTRNPGGLRTPTTSLDFPGMPNISGFYPPDIEGAVGENYYVQMVNSTYAIFNKSDGSIAQAARNTNTLWSSHGGRCQSDNDGDAIALYDEQAQRWVLTQFAVTAAPESVCFAISQTSDPTGAYYTYDLAAQRFPDYYKLGVWPVSGNNAYFMGTNSGLQGQYDVYALDRENMLLGLPARPAQFFQSYPNLLMPADSDGDTPPPANAPGLLYSIRDAGEAYFGNPANDSIDVYEFDVDWANSSNSTFTLSQVITNADGLSNFNWTVCGFFVSDCLPQGGTSVNIDSGSWWPQQRLQYRNFGGFETLVGTWTVDVLAVGDHAAPRWFELRRNIGAGSWNLRQEGTFAPDSDHRFNPSISMDASENIGLGYSVTSSSSFPSIRFTVHDASVDPLGTMEPEEVMVAGGGSQTGTANRWGDYASMDVDPVDDCTFWFTSEYYTSTSAAGWTTRIGAFKIPTCKNYLITAVDDTIEVCKADDTTSFSLSLSNSFDATTNMSQVGCPAGASCAFSPNPVVNPLSTTDLNITGLAGATGGAHLITATATDSVDNLATNDIDLNLFLFNGNPGTPVLSSPLDGAFAPSLGPDLTWSAVTDGQDYFVEVDNDPAFGSVDFSTTVNGGLTTAAASGLSENTCYYWRVTPSNLCGNGTTSNVFEFYTGASQSTTDFTSTDVPISIGTVPVTITSTLTIAGVGAINDVNVVDIDMTHSYAGDLTLTLESPTGTVVTIMNVGCGTDNNIDLSLDDEAAGTWGCAGGGPVGGGGTFQPSSALSAFDGENANGVWTLTVIDGFNGDGGSLNGWGLNFENFADNGNQCPSGFTVGGNVSGLTGSGLVLQNNLGDNLSIAADGSFVFPTSLPDFDPYAVTVLTQPNTPSQTCSVTNSSGNISGANVVSVSVTCTTDSFTVGGNISGLTGSGLVLQNNAGDNLPIAADGSFTFSASLVDLSSYVVTVLTQPSSPNQSCAVTNASGNLAGTNITNVAISCGAVTYTVGGNVSNLTGSGLVLQNNLGDNLPIANDGSFVFPTSLPDFDPYSVTVLSQPNTPSQTCTVTNASGNVSGSNITNVDVSCALTPDISFAGTNLIQDVCINPGPTAINPVTLTSIALNGYNNTISLAFNPVLPTGISGGFSNNNFVPATAPGTDSLLNLNIDNTATAGLNTITIEASGAGISTKSIDVDLTVIFGLSASPVVSSPSDGSISVATNTSFTWSAISGANNYDIDISTDPTFSSIDFSANVAGTSFSPGAALATGTVYYWRVRANNTCGATSFVIAAFETIGGGGSTTMSFCNSPALAIPDNDSNGTSDTLNIATIATITDIDVSLDVSHTWVGDLIFNVENDTTNTNVTIIDRPGRDGSGLGCSRNNIDTTLDDDSVTPVEGVCANPADPTIGAGPFSPNNPLSAFNAESLAGDWTLSISDNANNDDGTVNEWCVIATYGSGSGLAAADYSDLDSSYGVARHEGDGTSRLGNNWTADLSFVEGGDSPISEGGSGDDDGIVASGLWTEASPNAVIEATVSTSGFLYCWFDWNNDGTFEGSELGVSSSLSLISPLSNSIPVTVPSTSFGDGNDELLETRCRFYAVEQTLAPPNPIGSTDSGEVEDYKLPADQLTPVTLAFIKSERINSSLVIDWTTTTESGTIGFNVLGLVNNVWRQLNAQPISAKGMNSVSPHDYQFNAGDLMIEAFKIEELTINGEKQSYGPYVSYKTHGKYPNNRIINWQSITQESNLLASNRQESLKQGFSFVKVSVNETGIQRITHEDLVSAGVDWQGVSANEISISFENKSIARLVSSDVFGPGSHIDFVGFTADSLYTNTNVYVLKLDVYQSKNAIAITDDSYGVDNSAYHMATSINNKDVVYSFASPTNSPWLLQSMLAFTSPKEWSFPINAPYLLNNNVSSTLNVNAWGGTDWPQTNDHHLQVLLNNQLVSDVYSDGLDTINITENLNHSQINGASSITFRLPADTGVDYDLIQLDSFSIDFPAEIHAINNKLSFVPVVNTSINPDVIHTNGFENNFADDGFVVKGLSTQETTIYAVNGSNLYDFPLKKTNSVTGGYEIEIPKIPSTGVKYYINSNNALIRPSLSLANNSSLDLNQQYDYLMISHPDFISSLNQLVNYHQASGLSVLVVNVEDVYAEYSFHRKDANAIKTFIKDANLMTGIETVLLVGSDTSDYLDNLDLGSKSFVPTLYFPTDEIIKYAPVDSLFVDTNNDLIPDLSIGRLPVRTNIELQDIIDKIIQYANRSYKDTAIFASDRSSSFDLFSNQMVGLLPQNWQVEKAYVSVLDINAAQSSIINSIESGVSLTSYFGHSGPNTWSFEHLFDNNDILALNNLNKPTVINQFGCWNTYYVMPEFDTMAHHFMSQENKGAVAVLGASTLTQSNHESMLGNLLIPRITQNNVPVGLAILQAKQALAQNHPGYLDVLLGWNLLGDPMIYLNQE